MHSLDECRFKVTVVDQDRILDSVQDSEKFRPHPLLIFLVVLPHTLLNERPVGLKSDADQVEEIAFRQTFNVQIDGRYLDFQFRVPDDVNLLLANRERPQ